VTHEEQAQIEARAEKMSSRELAIALVLMTRAYEFACDTTASTRACLIRDGVSGTDAEQVTGLYLRLVQ
jgi:hypothetical protein